jgi:hypothetical protein
MQQFCVAVVGSRLTMDESSKLILGQPMLYSLSRQLKQRPMFFTSKGVFFQGPGI